MSNQNQNNDEIPFIYSVSIVSLIFNRSLQIINIPQNNLRENSNFF